MDFREDGQRRRGRFVLGNEALFRERLLKKGLQDEHLGRVVVSVELLHAPVFVVVDASHAVHAVFLLMERPAAFALVFVLVDPESGWRELFLPVGEAALLLVSAKARLNPVLAHLSLVFLLRIRR